MRWLVAASAALVLVVAATGFAASQVHAVGPLDAALLREAALNGGTIDQSISGTAECWAAGPVPPRLRVGPLHRCAGIVAPAQALDTLRYTGIHALAIGLADASWRTICPRAISCSGPTMRRRLVWAIEVDKLTGLPGPYLGIPSCTHGGRLFFVDAASGAPVMKIEWGPWLGPGGYGVGC